MAILTLKQLADIRQSCYKGAPAVDYDKTQINAMLQAVEDWFEANRNSLNTAINTATAPKVFTIAQKKRAVAYWLEQKFQTEKV